MKRRSLTVLLCLLAIISLASVGFASWVISADDTEVATGNIQVEDVTDERVDISNVVLSKKSFNFTAPENATTGWLKNETTNIANLSTILTFNVKIGGVAAEIGENVTITIDWDLTTKDLLDKAVDAGYILEVPELKVEYTADGNHKVEILFKWGTKFGGTAKVGDTQAVAGENPFTYYNRQKVNDALYYINGADEDDTTKYFKDADGQYFSDSKHQNPVNEESIIKNLKPFTWGDEAKATLQGLYKLFNEKTYSITINASPKTE